MGQWERGVRHGGGIFRSADGREYVGAWEANVREGYGVRLEFFCVVTVGVTRPTPFAVGIPKHSNAGESAIRFLLV